MEQRQKIKVNRTTEGTIFEAAFIILAIVVWALIIWMISQAPETIATHFDGHGRPNGYGSPWGLLVPCIITTLAGILLLVVCYFPHLINMPVKATTKRQYELTIRSTRIAALCMLLVTLAVPCTLLLLPSPPSPWPIMGSIGLLVVVAIYYSIRIHRAK